MKFCSFGTLVACVPELHACTHAGVYVCTCTYAVIIVHYISLVFRVLTNTANVCFLFICLMLNALRVLFDVVENMAKKLLLYIVGFQCFRKKGVIFLNFFAKIFGGIKNSPYLCNVVKDEG